MANEPSLNLTVGPILFHWPQQTLVDFYARLADEAPVDHVVVGEVVCSKRLPFYEDALPGVIERLQGAGKRVSLTSLALPTLARERSAARDLFASGIDVELSDLSALGQAGEGGFSIGPLINVYNEATLGFLARKGARSVCLPPELPLASVKTLAEAGRALGLNVEVWGYGRAPLAISARCYHARVRGLSKDSCQFACGADPDGLDVRTIDGRDFLAVNGVQTLGHAYIDLIGDLATVAEAGVKSVRLSPHSGDFVGTTQDFRAASEGRLEPAEAVARARARAPGATFSHGFLLGDYGAQPLSVA
jgi:O2-independent ubiquinone biosynthesis protein UbiV